MSNSLRNEFLLDSDIKYLNHGSFGACPKPVFKAYQDWQLELERNPANYYTRRIQGLFSHKAAGPLEESRAELAHFIGADPEGLIFVPNVTIALNAIAYSIDLKAGDEVLTTNHEYGTIIATWQRKCDQVGAELHQVDISLPVTTQNDYIEQFWSQVTARTKVILMSHITSATALVLPVEDICRKAREVGITTVIDGAHAVGQLDLDLSRIGADFYTSNCHKWLLTPKGTAFLHVHARQRNSYEPLVISWAEINRPSFALRHEMWGTRDLAGFLSIPAALKFRIQHDWGSVQSNARLNVLEYREKFRTLFDHEAICDDSWLGQMASILLPMNTQPAELWEYLWEHHRIEAMITKWQDKPILRIGYNAYNTRGEMDVFVKVIESYYNKA
ncbi:MAG: aminotransferase class V-fold PLP-dependent enzyme [Candidatus Marinimicrobia bacterium]|nr:aminotransferase class V-fold PLP-dependent enzyme [Candidatus Neomarinimicrobiota bacterium]